jgi:hypothetical protein
MNKHKLPVLGLGLLLLLSACKKNDVQYENMETTEQTVAAPVSAPVSEWKPANSWTSSKQEKFTTHTSKTDDSTITSTVTNSGLVLAFIKTGNSINALPFQEKGTSDSYWYYQVSNGSISFSCDSYSGTPSLNSAEFKYFVFSPEQLTDLEAKGYSKIKLMQLSYEEVAAIL